MNKVDRRKQELCDILAVYPELSIGDVVERMQISEATARRLFARLENEKILIRTHGGIKKNPELNMAYSYDLSITQDRQKKKAIGKHAAGIVNNGDKIFMDSGSTILMFGEALSERMVAGKLKNVTIVTNSLVYIEKLANLCRILLIGGEIRVHRRDVCGSSAEKNLAEYHFDHAFLGADSVSDEFGIMTTDELTANMNRVVIRQSESSHVLSASNKFGRTSFVTYAQANEVTSIITDADIENEQTSVFEKQDITLEIVPVV